MKQRSLLKGLTVLVLASLSACGGGGGAADAPAPRMAAMVGQLATDPSSRAGLTAPQASRLLAQASFGPTSASISEVISLGPEAWIEAQFLKSQLPHRRYLDAAAAAEPPGTRLSPTLFYQSFWQQAITGRDQLRQRMTFALSQIFVVSLVDDAIVSRPRGVASYYDVLGKYAFGNYRDLLEAVTRHPMMGLYLTYLRNQKEEGARLPDENFAREIMQLMSIGLYQLNQDGTLKTNAGKPIETYSHADVEGLAKVFTGWSWAGPDRGSPRFRGIVADPERDVTPMQNYPTYHSTSDKTFLGVTASGGSADADLKIALDTLFQHPNVGPFFGRQLIQRLVTSNPSPAYVSRVAAAFNNNGSGVRGDMKAVIRAVLLDPEARGAAAHPQKLREPILRVANWMRAFNAQSTSGRFLMVAQDDPLTDLGQTPMRSPSVFNYYRPGYVPPNTSIAAAGLVAPEMQITGEASVVGYLNYIRETVPFGTGTGRDILPSYTAEVALALTPDLLVDRVNLLLLNGGMSSTLRTRIATAVNAIRQPVPSANNAAQVLYAKQNRVWMAVFLAMASPEYLVQK